MLKQAIDKPATTHKSSQKLSDSNWLNLLNASSDQSNTGSNLDTTIKAGQISTGSSAVGSSVIKSSAVNSLGTALLTANSQVTNLPVANLQVPNSQVTHASIANALTVADAPDTGNLFGLSSTSSKNALGSATTAARYDTLIEWGHPETDQYYWREQSGQDSCAVVAQISAYQSLTGNYVSEQAACNYAQAKGWFNPQSGTPLRYMGKILNALGISTTQEYHATLGTIATALNEGDKPIVALNANEIWYPKHDRYGNPVEQSVAGHAVWVTGIDEEANGSFDVVLNDSGTPYGRSEVVSYRDFYNAWSDYNCFLTVADNPFT
jgi:hypothetical protein